MSGLLSLPRSLNASLAVTLQGDGGDGWIGQWSPGIGDPTVVGWVTVVGYLVVSYLCWRAFKVTQSHTPVQERRSLGLLLPIVFSFVGGRRRLSNISSATRTSALWLGMAVVLLLLGINKQLDLQTVVTELGRIVARHQGWYARRRRVQGVFILAVACAGLWMVGAVWRLARGSLRRLRMVLLGTIFLVCFVAIRAASFHHVDSFIGYDIGGFKMNWIVELGGIGLVGVGAWRGMRAAPDEVVHER